MKEFLKKPGGADLYEALEIKWIGGKSPELVLYSDENLDLEIERIDIAPYSAAELHSLMKEKGFIPSGRPMMFEDFGDDEDDLEEAYCGKTKTQLLVEERVANLSYLEIFLQAPIYNAGMTFSFCGLLLLVAHLGQKMFFKDEYVENLRREIEESRKMRMRAEAKMGFA